eukprot:CAMPEP_0171690932 /NCGR_PEP_ID=MMETSP0991-20121206/5258_1 /TAXON_ID=483369 /ORGANISM="non described non described, Strain CCMP2098" /LENGTH=62 /DNA_ID=CAMNT_0012279105 /DNA_START=390 /DNA_END=575 /DNA_ORIENTATION=+
MTKVRISALRTTKRLSTVGSASTPVKLSGRSLAASTTLFWRPCLATLKRRGGGLASRRRGRF